MSELVQQPIPTDNLPNIVLINFDDLGYGDLGCYGAVGFATPRIDQLAATGVKLTSLYASASVCTPSRASLLTGQYPQRVGMGGVIGPDSKTGLDPETTTTLAELLSAQGYATAAIGKWHLGHHKEFLPTRHGFDTFYGIPYSNDMEPYVFLRDEEVIEEPFEQATLTSRLTDEAIRFTDANADGPFFLYLAHPMPHKPLAARDRFLGSSEAGLYGDVMHEVDHEVGRLLDHLSESGLRENTIIVLTSDNGPWQPWDVVDHSIGGSAGVLRGKKANDYEGGFRVPGIVSWAGQLPAGETRTGMLAQMDLFPSLLAWAGVDVADIPENDGLDLRDYLSGAADASPRDTFYFYHYGKLFGLRHQQWKLMFSRQNRDDHWHAYKDDPARAESQWGSALEWQPERLFNLSQNPDERVDYFEAEPQTVAKLKAFADDARQDLGDTLTGVEGTGVGEPGRVDE